MMRLYAAVVAVELIVLLGLWMFARHFRLMTPGAECPAPSP